MTEAEIASLVAEQIAAAGADKPTESKEPTPAPAELDYSKLADAVASRLKPPTQEQPKGNPLADALAALAGSGSDAAAAPVPYTSPGGANGPPRSEYEDITNPVRWSADMVARFVEDGSFSERLEKFRASLPGGSGSVFRKRIPKIG
jgi:hypothetical protein